jgi:hypothetical protein
MQINVEINAGALFYNVTIVNTCKDMKYLVNMQVVNDPGIGF